MLEKLIVFLVILSFILVLCFYGERGTRGKLTVFLMILSLILVLCSHFFCLFLYGRQPASIRSHIREETPYIFYSDEDYFANIQKVRITDDYVFVLYGGKSIIKVYQHDGSYIASIAIHQQKSGDTQLYTDNKRMYIARDSYLYEFEGLEFIHCYSREQGDLTNELLAQIEKKKMLATEYSFSAGNLIKNAGSPSELVFYKRDLLHRIADPGFLLPAEVFVCLLWYLVLKLKTL